MKKLLYIVIGAVLLSSCLKKLDEVETANNNIFDPDFEGEQWYVLDTLYEYTNTFNNQYIKFEGHIKEEYTPQLKPSKIDLAVNINEGDLLWLQAPIDFYGIYNIEFSITPNGSSNYCLDMGVGVIDEGDTLIINRFTECKDL